MDGRTYGQTDEFTRGIGRMPENAEREDGWILEGKTEKQEMDKMENALTKQTDGQRDGGMRGCETGW